MTHLLCRSFLISKTGCWLPLPGEASLGVRVGLVQWRPALVRVPLQMTFVSILLLLLKKIMILE